MLNRIHKIIVLLTLMALPLMSQIALVNEDYQSGHYRLHFNNLGYVYNFQQNNGKRIIRFLIPYDEGREASPILPRKDLFIALPPNSRSPIKFGILAQNVIPNVIPELTPAIRYPYDSLVSYKKVFGEPAIKPINSSYYKFNGYLWIGGNYCAHVTIFPYLYDEQQNQINELKEFQIDLDVVSDPVNISSRRILTSASDLIVNSDYAANWKSAQPGTRIAQTDSWIDYSQEYLKIGIALDGIYRLTYSDLKNYGVPVGTINPRALKLFLKGNEIPIFVSGESGNVFSPGNYIEFLGRRNYGDSKYREVAEYGTPYREYLNPYSDTTVYWLSWSGGFGKRVDTTVVVATAPNDTTRYYDELVHQELNYYWDYSLSGGDVRKNYPDIVENKTWNEGHFDLGTASKQFFITNLYPNKPAKAFAKLQDYSSNIDLNAHNLALSINSNATRYDSGFTNKYQVKTLAASFLSALLANGINTINITSYPTQNTINSVTRDWWELEYPRALITDTDSLTFAYRSNLMPTISRYSIEGVKNIQYSLYRFIWNDSSVIKITNYVLNNGTIQFNDTLAAGRTYFLMGEYKISTPIIYYKKKFVNLRNSSTQAEYIAITHPYFKTSATNYISFISSAYNISTKLIDVYDIYDEFNYGFLAAEPIREFLRAANQNWQTPKPKYVFLIGKASYDFYSNKTRYFGAPAITDFVPSYGNPVSDVWYTIWDSTGAMIPQMDIGRIPAKNIDEFQSYFSKHQKYVAKGFDDWNKHYIFFSGGDFTDTVQLAQSKSVNDAVINNFVAVPPVGGIITNFYKTANPVTNFGPYSAAYIKAAIDEGGVFISYIGHSGTQTWDNSITEVGQLANIRDRNPLITDFGCSTGKFAEPDVLSFSELATNDFKGQAIAYIGNSSLGFTTTAYSFPQVFYKKLLLDTSVSIGETHRLAKVDYLTQYGVSSVFGLFTLTNTLIGDPIVKLPIPSKPNFSVLNTTLVTTPSHPTEQTDTVSIEMEYNNYGKVTRDSVDIQINDEYLSKIIYSHIVRRKIPLFTDSITVGIPIHMMPGKHTLTVKIDPFNSIDEITKSDNIFTSTIVVASSNTRNLTLSQISNQTSGELTFLNPSAKTSDSKFIIETSSNSSYSPSQVYQVPFDTFSTKFKFDASLFGKRFWMRTKNEAQNIEGLTYSYFYGAKTNYLINDSISFSRVASVNMKPFVSTIILDTTNIIFSAISAGFSDGRTVLITKNGENFIPTNTLRGHHVVLFDAATYEYAGYFKFDVLSGGNEIARYKAFFDTLTSKYIVIIAICDEGASNLDGQLKNDIKGLGSKFIDSVVFRGSWAIIGRKGAATGSVSERYSEPFAGRIQVDSTVQIPYSNGTFETEQIGPVSAWRNAEIRYAKPPGGTINISILGIKANNFADTLKSAALIDTSIDISAVNAQIYPTIKIVGALGRASGQVAPSINSIAVNYDQLAELGTNYQVVHAHLYDNAGQGKELSAGDSVLQGEKVLLTYRVYNAGGVVAKKIGIQAGAVWDNNNTESIASTVIDSLPPLSYKQLSAVYNTSLGSGRRSLRITIDPDTLIRELFKDNNIYAFPIYVKKDSLKPLLPNLTITPKNIYPLMSPVTDEKDTTLFAIVYGNTGAFISDSITISIRQFYKDVNIASWTTRRKYPPEMDTIILSVPILKRAGEHQLQVEIDPVGLIVESTKADNIASAYFTVVTTDFKILQPTSLSTSNFSKLVFLNPTSAVSITSKVADLELDTLVNFSTARKAQLPMQEFTTSFDISSLKNSNRYYWRIKQEQSGKDWSTGSFYLGELATYSIGQNDSTAWNSNVYVHTAASTSGVQIADTRTTIKAVSAGFSDGRTGSIVVNGINVLAPIFGTGHNLIVVDTSTNAVVARKRFDISNSAGDSDSLTQFIGSVSSGFIVGDVVVDEGSNNLTASARNALKTIGSMYIDKLTWRDSWAIIGRKGAAIGSVSETYVPQFGGTAVAETTLVKKEFNGTTVTQVFGPLANVSAFSMTGNIPVGTSVQTTFIGTRLNNVVDTMVLTSGKTLSNAGIHNSAIYTGAKIIFSLQTSGPVSPVISGWKLTVLPPNELAVSEQTTSINRSQVMEGEPIYFIGKIFNVSAAPADSVTVQLSANEGGFEKILKKQKYAVIPGFDSVAFTYTYSSKGKTGNFAFTLKVDPADSLLELSKDNNIVSVPYTVQSDTVHPQIQLAVDGDQVLDGDYVRQQPDITIRYSDNNPTVITSADTANFKIRLNNYPVYFLSGVAELITSMSPGQAQLKWTPTLPKGENFIQVYANDVTGNSSDTTTLYVNVSTEFMLQDIYNIPNPFAGSTHFTFNMLSPVVPDEVSIKIFTVAGRLIHDIPIVCKIGFNKIYWDGRDRDGDEIANGVYFYKIIVKQGDKQTSAIGKLVKMK